MIKRLVYKLPKEYQQVEYLKGDEKSWIDTQIPLNNTDSYEFEIKATLRDFTYPYGALYGTIDYQKGFMALYRYNNLYDVYSKFTAYRSVGLYADYIGKTITHKFIIDRDNNVCITDFNGNVRSTAISGNFTDDLPILIYRAGHVSYALKQDEVYFFKITQNGNLVRDLIPCYRKVDNVAGMYDLVSKTFFTNSGSGEFIVGNDVKGELKQIKSIKRYIGGEVKDITKLNKMINGEIKTIYI